jgi:hypothetical protein
VLALRLALAVLVAVAKAMRQVVRQVAHLVLERQTQEVVVEPPTTEPLVVVASWLCVTQPQQ